MHSRRFLGGLQTNLNFEQSGDALYLPCGWWHAVVGSQDDDQKGVSKNAVWLRDRN